MVGERSLLDLNIPRRQTLRQLRRLKIKSTFETLSKRFKEEGTYNKVRLMYQDEAGFGRISKMSSCWAPQGIRPSIPSHYMREYRYCYGAVDAQTGDSFYLIAGGCNTEWTNEFLRQVSQAYPDDYILLVMDNAIWHKSSTLDIELTFIPPYTPEMNPIEQVWKEIRKRGFKNKAFRTLEDVMKQLQDVIQGLEKTVIKSIVNRRWTRMLFESR